MAQPETIIHPDFFASVNRLDGAMIKRVTKALEQFVIDPDHPSLNFHPIQGDRSGRLYSIRANDDVRILVSKEGNLYTFLAADHHDALYERALRGRFLANAGTGFIGFVERSSAAEAASHQPGSGRRTAPDRRIEGPGPLDHWTDAELIEAGLSADQTVLVRACRTENDVCDLDVEEDVLDLLFQLVEQTPEQWFAPSLDPAAEAEERLRALIARNGAVNGLSPIFTPEEVERLAAAPIEEWMIFLHPDQRAIVERRYEGPARIRGSAGTGKTVVALHRAAELAQRFTAEAAEGDHAPQPILFTTYIKSLPAVFERLYERLPKAIPGAVEFIHVDKLANRICREEGRPVQHEPRAIDAAFRSATKRVVVPGSPLDVLGLTHGYLREEITAVIKGRGVRSVDEYLAMERTGRRTRLLPPHRSQVWELREAWDEEMSKRGTVDFVDAIVRARDLARQRPASTYRAALIDEAQDLNLVGLQLIRTLVNGPARDRPDGLLIVGDGAQRIYPGGFTLRQAGVEVRGRTTVLRTNYRNTGAIIRTAMAVAGEDVVDDLGEEFQRGEAEAEPRREEGVPPTYVCASDSQSQLAWVAETIARYRDDADDGINIGDIAVCAASNRQAEEASRTLNDAGIDTIELAQYDGAPIDKVKTGTFHRVKGLEFKVVFLIGLGAEEFPRQRQAGQSEQEYEEAVSTQMSTLFVAMTRARDALVLLGTGSPSPAIAQAADHLALVDG
ncbi:MAG: 3'-5' exonuclease [Acidimicrobiales bacterium]